MTLKNVVLAALSVVVSVAGSGGCGAARAASTTATLSLGPEKASYLSGEIVTLRLSVSPQDREAFVPRPDVGSSRLTIYVSFEKEPFKVYQAPGWGHIDSISRPVRVTRERPYSLEVDLFY